MTTAKDQQGNADGGPQMDHPDVVAARIAHGVDDQAKSKKSAKSDD